VDNDQRPLAVRLLEVIAAGMGIDHGFTELHVDFEDGRVRRWGTTDLRNSPRQLQRCDERLWAGLTALMQA